MKLDLDEKDLRPIVAAVVAETLDRMDFDRAKLNGRIGFTEPEAAGLLGVQSYVLRDARLRGEISARKVGRRFVYSRAALEKYLDK